MLSRRCEEKGSCLEGQAGPGRQNSPTCLDSPAKRKTDTIDYPDLVVRLAQSCSGGELAQEGAARGVSLWPLPSDPMGMGIVMSVSMFA